MSKDDLAAGHLSLAVNNARLPVRLLDSTVLHGCNVLHNTTVIRQRVDLGSLTGARSGSASREFASKFIERFMGLQQMQPPGHMSTDFLGRLNERAGAPLVEVLFEAILAVEASLCFTMGKLSPISYAEILPTRSPAWYDLVWECTDMRISRGAARLGYKGLLELLPKSFGVDPGTYTNDFQTGLENLRIVAVRRQRSTAAEVLALAAKKRGLPCEHIGSTYLLLGHGISQRSIHDSYRGPGNTQAIVADGDALLAKAVARDISRYELPLPERWPASTVADASLAADSLGYPVVLKPLKGRQLSRMSIGVKIRADIHHAFEHTRRDGKGVMVEKFIEGQQHRLMIVDGRMVAALHIIPPSVIGDGVRNISRLIDELNSDPLRNGIRQYQIEVTEKLVHSLALAGHDLLDVPANGTEVRLEFIRDISAGATHIDVTDIVHPDNQEVSVQAATHSKLLVAGVDFVCPDITRSYRDAGGSIIDINAEPELHFHKWPRHGSSRDVGGDILRLAFPGHGKGNIPLVMLVGENGMGRVGRDFDRIMLAANKTAAIALPNSSTIGGEPIEHAISLPREATRFMLQDPRAEIVLGTRSPRSIVNQGLGIEKCDVAAILDPAEDGNLEVYSQGLRVLLEATQGMVVVDAANRIAFELLQLVEFKQVVLVSQRQGDRKINRHLNMGGIAVTVGREQGRSNIVLKRKDRIYASIPIASLINTRTTRVGPREIQDRMFAVALAYGIGLRGNDLRVTVKGPAPLSLEAP
jgi:cyanophycin synthetase